MQIQEEHAKLFTDSKPRSGLNATHYATLLPVNYKS